VKLAKLGDDKYPIFTTPKWVEQYYNMILLNPSADGLDLLL